MSEALFEYCVRFSPKGRNIRLRVTSQRGLEVVVPKGYDVDKVPGLLERKKHWVRAALQRELRSILRDGKKVIDELVELKRASEVSSEPRELSKTEESETRRPALKRYINE